MAQARLKADPFHNGNVYSFPRAAYGPDEATAALDLVYQAADVFRNQQERARETEERAHALCRAAAEKLKLAERRAEAAEQALRDVMATVDQKLKDASTALELAQSRVSAQADQVAAAEFRTQTALAETREAKKALMLVEETIRRRLLTVSSKA
jgi:predicted  nucleic acid-binding Zn-ribbon protein